MTAAQMTSPEQKQVQTKKPFKLFASEDTPCPSSNIQELLTLET